MLLHVPTTSSTTPAHESLDRDFLRFVAQLPTLCDDLSVPETQLMLSQTRGNSGDSDHSTADHAVQVPALTSLTGDCYHLDATPAWNPTPSAPEYYREELTRKLADLEGLLPDSSSTLVQQHDTAIAEDLEAANAGAPLGLMPDHDSLERKRATNRKAQKVFRAKRKVLQHYSNTKACNLHCCSLQSPKQGLLQGRAQAVEIQLANTVQELEELKLNQQQLMRKNLILQNMCKEGNCQPPEDVSHCCCKHNTCAVCRLVFSTGLTV